MKVLMYNKEKWEDFTYWLSKKKTSFTYIFRKPYYRLKLFRRFMKTPYWGPWETCYLYLDYSFEIFCEYYEQGGKDWKPDESPWKEAKEEMDVLYLWYTETKQRREEEINYLLSVWSEHYTSWFEDCEDEQWCSYEHASSRYCDYLHMLHHEEEEKFVQEQEDMLIRLVKIRNFCWE